MLRARKTGLQKQVVDLYRRSVRMVITKPPEHRPAWYSFVAHQFRSQSLGGGLRPRDHAAVEHLLRRGEKQLEMYRRPEVKTVAPPNGSEHWTSPLARLRRGTERNV